MVRTRVNVRTRLQNWVERIVTALKASVTETHSPHQIASSFAIGVFITMLPTLGTGLLLFVVLSYLFNWINKVALLASVIVLNPVVKWGVYAASVSLGFLLLGPVEGQVVTEFSMDAGREVILRLLIGNLILAIVATIIAYGAVYRLITRYQDQAKSMAEVVIDEVGEELFD